MNGGRVQDVEGEELSFLAFSQANASAGRKIVHADASVIRHIDALDDVILQNKVARLVISLKNRMGKIDDISLFDKGGIFGRLGFEGCVFVSAEVCDGAVEVGLMHAGEHLALRSRAIRMRVG